MQSKISGKKNPFGLCINLSQGTSLKQFMYRLKLLTFSDFSMQQRITKSKAKCRNLYKSYVKYLAYIS